MNLLVTVHGVIFYQGDVALGSKQNARRVSKAVHDLAQERGARVQVKTARAGWEDRVVIERGGRYYLRLGSIPDQQRREENPSLAV